MFLKHVDLSGKLAIVTGGYSGLGLVTTTALAGAGVEVIIRPDGLRLHSRRPAIRGVAVERLDLADLDSIREFADPFLASQRPIDIVINNAGIMACAETRVGPGWEAQFATNHLGQQRTGEPSVAGPHKVSRQARLVAVKPFDCGITAPHYEPKRS